MRSRLLPNLTILAKLGVLVVIVVAALAAQYVFGTSAVGAVEGALDRQHKTDMVLALTGNRLSASAYEVQVNLYKAIG